jgi:hypothetical protein
MKFVEVKSPENIAALIARIEAHNQRITQIKASLDIKAHGIMAGFLHEQADVVMQPPQYMYWSLRSFFEMPSMIVASNGEYLTAYDFSGQSREPYQITAMHGDTFFEVMDFRLHPASIIQILTQRIPLEGARGLQFSTSEQRLAMRGELDSGWVMDVIYDLATDRLVTFELRNMPLMMSYQARYTNYRSVDGIDFPSSIVLVAKGKSRSAKLQIEFLQTELNGQLVLPDVFYVKPH